MWDCFQALGLIKWMDGKGLDGPLYEVISNRWTRSIAKQQLRWTWIRQVSTDTHLKTADLTQVCGTNTTGWGKWSGHQSARSWQQSWRNWLSPHGVKTPHLEGSDTRSCQQEEDDSEWSTGQTHPLWAFQLKRYLLGIQQTDSAAYAPH